MYTSSYICLINGKIAKRFLFAGYFGTTPSPPPTLISDERHCTFYICLFTRRDIPVLYRTQWSGRIFISKTILLYAIYRDSLFNKPPITRANTKRALKIKFIFEQKHDILIILSVVNDRRKRRKNGGEIKLVFIVQKNNKKIWLFGKQDQSKVIS